MFRRKGTFSRAMVMKVARLQMVGYVSMDALP